MTDVKKAAGRPVSALVCQAAKPGRCCFSDERSIGPAWGGRQGIALASCELLAASKLATIAGGWGAGRFLRHESRARPRKQAPGRVIWARAPFCAIAGRQGSEGRQGKECSDCSDLEGRESEQLAPFESRALLGFPASVPTVPTVPTCFIVLGASSVCSDTQKRGKLEKMDRKVQKMEVFARLPTRIKKPENLRT